MTERARPDEVACFEVFRRVTGFRVTPNDHSGRQGAVDGVLVYPDGRIAAIEITSVAEEGRQQLENLLAADEFTWTCRGTWRWIVSIADPAELPHARRVMQKVVDACEAAGVSCPQQLSWDQLDADEDLRWAAGAGVIFHGAPSLTADLDSEGMAVVHAHPSGVGGFADESLQTFDAELCQLLARASVEKRIRKLNQSTANERHLMMVVHLTAFSFAIIDSFMSGTTLPPVPPSCLPGGLTALWLVPVFGRRVLLWDGTAWREHRVLDEPDV